MRPLHLPLCLVVAGALALAGCGGSDSKASTSTTRPAGSATSTTVADDGPQITVRVVADSEIADGIAELLDQEPGIEVQSHHSVNGATMAQLDELADDAVAAKPDVFVYSGGTNDLPSGPVAMLDGLKERLTRYGKDTCVVMAVPIFRYERGTKAEVAERTAGTRVLEREAASTGAKVASYLDVSMAMDDRDQDFFAEGELGNMHPGSAAYPGIADSIAKQVRACAPKG